jgi:hypothetical protein
MANPPAKTTFNRPDGVALREHLESRIAAQQEFFTARLVAMEQARQVATSAQQEFFTARLAAMEQATQIATTSLTERLGTMNEMRAALGDLSAIMVTRAEMTIQIEKLNQQIDDLKRSRDLSEGKASQKSVDLATLLAIGGLVLGVVGLVMNLL